MDLKGAQESYEDECIEIITGHTYVFRPKKLVYEFIDEDLEWCYFRLINAGLASTGVYERYLRSHEEVLELRPFRFVDRVHWDEQQYDGEKLPKEARVISRILKGDLVIFKKSSLYNLNTATYDGRHEKLGEKGFKKHILQAYEYIKSQDA